MAYPTFSPLTHPDQAMDRTVEPKMRTNQFGDGYEQVATNGINNMLEQITPKWTNARNNEGTYIIGFIEGRKGLPFLWQPNGQGPVRAYRCLSMTKAQKKGNYWNISLTLKEMPRI